MELIFDNVQYVGPGKNPAGVHFATNDVQIFYVNADGRVEARGASTPMGDWDNLTFGAPVIAASDKNIKHMTLKSFPRFGIYGVWHSDDRHRLAIYEYAYDISEYLLNGTISSTIDNAIVGLSLTLTNEDEVIASEDDALLTPGSKIYLEFKAGDSSPYPMATFYVDRSEYDAETAEVVITARNTIGKILNDSTFDENHTYLYEAMSEVLKKMFINAGIPEDKFLIRPTVSERGMSFPPDMSYLDGFEEMFKTGTEWRLHEVANGTIIAGRDDYEHMPSRGTYTFYRDKDVISRSVVRDDAEAYARVCVRSEVAMHGTGTVTTESTNLNVRPEPNTNLDPIGSLPNGTVVQVLLEVGNGWLEIQSGELRGYVSGKYINWTKGGESSIIYAYAQVPYYEEWGLPKNKTKYVDAAKGTTQEEIDQQALDLAEKISYSGVIESFVGPWRPHIQEGDSAEIIDDYGRKLIGAITQLDRPFGQDGFWTEFTVDSGEVMGKGRATDYIKKIAGHQEPRGGVVRIYPPEPV